VRINKKYIIIATLIACTGLYIVEQGIEVNYAIKTLIKIILFIGIPIVYIKYIKKESLKESLKLKSLKKSGLKIGFLAGILFFIIVLSAYFVVQGEIDLNSIAEELQTKLKVTPINFIFIALYITFGNSFLEEFFFRGFIFLNLYGLNSKKTAYVYSSLLFGLYHIGIFRTWFDLPITLLALFGLISVGFLFNWMDTKSDNFLNSWIAHIFADTAVMLIGFKMFGMI
jgi:uncharacterized protein